MLVSDVASRSSTSCSSRAGSSPSLLAKVVAYVICGHLALLGFWWMRPGPPPLPPARLQVRECRPPPTPRPSQGQVPVARATPRTATPAPTRPTPAPARQQTPSPKKAASKVAKQPGKKVTQQTPSAPAQAAPSQRQAAREAVMRQLQASVAALPGEQDLVQTTEKSATPTRAVTWDAERLIAYLQARLEVPEAGQCLAQFTLDSSGRIVQIHLLRGSSAAVENTVREQLQGMVLPVSIWPGAAPRDLRITFEVD